MRDALLAAMAGYILIKVALGVWWFRRWGGGTGCEVAEPKDNGGRISE